MPQLDDASVSLFESRCNRETRVDTPRTPTTATVIHGTASMGPWPVGCGGTDPMRVLLVPDGARPIATTLVPTEIESSLPAEMSIAKVPVSSARTVNAGRLPTRTSTTDKPRNPIPVTASCGEALSVDAPNCT